MKLQVYLVSVALLLSFAVGIKQPGQYHNLSEIHPVDTDFNMSDRSIHNISQLRLNDGTVSGTGLVLDDYGIRDAGNNYGFVLDPANELWRVTGSNLDLGGNNITDVNRMHILDSGSSPGDRMLQVGDDTYFTDLDISNTLGVQGIQDSSVANIRLGGSGPTLSGRSDGSLGIDGGLDMEGNSITSSGGEICAGDQC